MREDRALAAGRALALVYLREPGSLRNLKYLLLYKHATKLVGFAYTTPKIVHPERQTHPRYQELSVISIRGWRDRAKGRMNSISSDLGHGMIEESSSTMRSLPLHY